jgi:UbiA prenyltransferase family
MLRAWLELARISNLPTVWTNVTAGWLLAGGELTQPILLWLLLAGSLLYTGGMILNDAADARHDAAHKATRPIPRGTLSVGTAWSVGAAMLALGAAVAIQWGEACWGITTALVVCILFYDLYHKPWAGAVFVMGMCRVLLFLMAVSAETAWWLHLAPAFILGAYIVGLTLVARQEARPGLPSPWQRTAAYTLLAMPGIHAFYQLWESGIQRVFILGDLAPLAPLPLIFVFVAMLIVTTRIMRQGGPQVGRAVGLLLAGIPVVDALAVSTVSLPLACGFVCLAPLLRLWQRWIAAT